MAETFRDTQDTLITRLTFKLTKSQILQPVLKVPDYVSIDLSNYSDY